MPESREPSAALSKVTRRLMPVLFVLYTLNFLDRVNVGFAALEMNRDLGFSASVYGLGAGIFFLAYALFEVPSNLILLRTGARLWIARIMITWGIVASLMLFIRTPASFYVARCLLGLAEAGFFPGIILYLTYWYPARDRGRAYSWFLAAIPISGVLGGPVSGALLGLNGRLGLAGWQWLFLLEGLPSVLAGCLVLVYLPDGPSTARWLQPHERSWLESVLESEHHSVVTQHGASLAKTLRSPTVWRLALLYFLIIVGLYSLTLWLPQMVRAYGGWTNLEIGIVSAMPYLVGAVGMVAVGSHSDRTGERRLHIAVPALVAAVGFVASAYFRTPVAGVTALCLAGFGVFGALGVFWSLPAAFLKDRAAAGGIALINSIGALGGFVGPYLLGVVKDRTGSLTGALLALAAALAAAAGVALRANRPP